MRTLLEQLLVEQLGGLLLELIKKDALLQQLSEENVKLQAQEKEKDG